MRRPIAISISPNTQKDDVLLALRALLSPIKWFDFRETEKFENEFAAYFGKKYKAIAVNAGRSAMYLILKVLGIGAGDDVVVQALTCVAVPNSIIWLDANPVYADVDDTFNIDPKDLSEKISEKTKAIVTQHSFGIPASFEKIQKVARSSKKGSKVYIIEDCALALGAKYKGRKVGTLGDVSFFSTGRDKVISSVFGGVILCKDKRLYERLKEERDRLEYPSFLWVIQQLLHPILFSIALPTYNFGFGKLTLGKLIIFLSQILKLTSKPVYREEEVGGRPKQFPKKMPGVLAILAQNQFRKLEEFNKHRRKLAKIYFRSIKDKSFKLPPNVNGSIWVRFPVITEKANEVMKCAKSREILLGDWYKDLVVPVEKPFYVNYSRGSCPNAEKLLGKMLNLPTYPNLGEQQVKEVIGAIEQC